MPRILVVLALFLLPFSISAGADDEWLPISPEELKMTSEPKAPGAPAIILFRQIDREDNDSRESRYVRTKIFTDQGREYANVQVPFLKGQETIRNIKARTIRPDGSIADFDGKVYEKEIVKARGIKILAKVFTLPDVQPGSIIEYKYTVEFLGYFFNPRWVLSDELFTEHAKFFLKPRHISMRTSWPNGLPPGVNPPVDDGSSIRMEIRDIPGFQAEEDMPPENGLKYIVNFVYSYSATGFEKDTDLFWKKAGEFWWSGEESFVNKRKTMEQAVAQIVSPSDSPDLKLRKLYDHAQAIRNTSYEIERTEQEQKRAKEKVIENVEDIWKRGYGDEFQINWLFLALARAAGFDASAVRTARRDDHFFNKKMMNAWDLGTNVVVVKLDGKDLFLDPGVPHAPFGVLPWAVSGVEGLKLEKDGGTWLTTPTTESSLSQSIRKADLRLNEEGSLEGKLTVTFTGLEALWRRVNEHNEDETHRKKMLEDYVKEIVPVAIEVELTNKPDWASSSPSLVAEYSLKVPGWVSTAGRRAFLPAGLFGASEKHIYEHATRIHPLYFHYTYEKLDDVRIGLPSGWKVSSLPQPVTNDAKVIVYTQKAEDDKGTLQLQRSLKSSLTIVDPKSYGTLRNFYQTVRSADEQQIVLQPASGSSGN